MQFETRTLGERECAKNEAKPQPAATGAELAEKTAPKPVAQTAPAAAPAAAAPEVPPAACAVRAFISHRVMSGW